MMGRSSTHGSFPGVTCAKNLVNNMRGWGQAGRQAGAVDTRVSRPYDNKQSSARKSKVTVHTKQERLHCKPHRDSRVQAATTIGHECPM